jgi:hypothetical protein
MTKHMVEDFTSIWMVQNTRAIGSKTSNMAWAKRSGKTGQHMKVNTRMVRSMERENFCGLTSLLTLEIFYRTIFMDSEFIPGMMVESLKENGKATRWMAMVYLLGQMVVNILETIKKIESMDKDSLYGQTEGNIREGGQMANSMEEAPILLRAERKRTENGRTVNVLNGSLDLNLFVLMVVV